MTAMPPTVDDGREARFLTAVENVVGGTDNRDGIGTLGEKTLHAALKLYFEPDTAYHEIKTGRFYADIAREGRIIEIQTRSFNRLREKIPYFLDEGYIVTVVYPVPAIKWLSWIDPECGSVSEKRKSPKKGSVYSIIPELYKIKPWLGNRNLEFEILLLEVYDYRNLDGFGKDRKIRSTRYERIPISLLGETCTGAADGFSAFIPDNLPEKFTSSDFAAAAKITKPLASTALSILYGVSAVERIGKKGRAYLYKLSNRI